MDRSILLAEDDDLDAELTVDALKGAGVNANIVRVYDGVEALQYLRRTDAFATRKTDDPLFVLLDLKMPRMDGHEALREIRADPKLHLLPVVMLTSSSMESDIVTSWAEGINAYVVKPVSPADYEQAVKVLGKFWAKVNLTS